MCWWGQLMRMTTGLFWFVPFFTINTSLQRLKSESLIHDRILTDDIIQGKKNFIFKLLWWKLSQTASLQKGCKVRKNEVFQNVGLIVFMNILFYTKVILWPAESLQLQSGNVTHCHTEFRGMGLHVVYLSARYRYCFSAKFY